MGSYSDLFNKWDFSPYHEKDLEQELVDYLVGCFQEIPSGSNVVVSFHLPKTVYNPDLEEQFTRSIYYHLSYGRSQLEQEKRALFQDACSMRVMVSVLWVWPGFCPAFWMLSS